MTNILKKYRVVGWCIVFSLLFYISHKKLLHVEVFEQSIRLSVEKLHLIFGSFSVIIVFLLTIVYYKNIDIVGYLYLWITLFKMILLLVIFKHFILIEPEKQTVEKQIILILFLIYLGLETFLIATLLNKNHHK